ncbi:putative transporter [Aphelenchoides besseyi]|nr:putative transporter [Aphelenchoides besseyi]KAI6207789.1 putative transporter [Aphelenchoides besseyi]
MDEATAGGSNELRQHASYGAVTKKANMMAKSPTVGGSVIENPDRDDRQELLSHEQRISSPMGETPDQILNSLGPFNPYILMVFSLMAIIWAVAAMPVMTSAWLVGNICSENTTNCVTTPGSVVEEFNLTGKEARYGDMTTMAFLIGNAIGGSIINRFSDLRGRRTALLFALACYGVFGIAGSFSRSVWQLMALRLFQGILFPGCGVINWVLAYESSPMALRKYAPLIFGLFWVIGYTLLAPIAYFFPHWRAILVAASLPSLVSAAILFFVLPDSFHWLVNEEREEDVQQWLNAANRFARRPRLDLNAATIIRDHHKTKNSKPEASKRGIISELMQSRVLLIYTVILSYLWTVDSFVYYGLSLFSTELAGNKFLNYILSGLVEVPSYLFSPFLLNCLGRRLFVSGGHFLTAAAFIGLMFVNNTTFSLILWLIGKFAISCCFTSLFVYASELFPTSLRNGCMGVAVFMAKVGSIFAPFTRTLANIWILLPALTFALLSGVGGLATLVLKETKGCELPDTSSEIGEDDEQR